MYSVIRCTDGKFDTSRKSSSIARSCCLDEGCFQLWHFSFSLNDQLSSFDPQLDGCFFYASERNEYDKFLRTIIEIYRNIYCLIHTSQKKLKERNKRQRRMKDNSCLLFVEYWKNIWLQSKHTSVHIHICILFIVISLFLVYACPKTQN
jgi:hypothetical protein